jgi:predicted nucleotidyltransferase
MTLEELRSRREDILAAVLRHGGKPNVRVFGSIARGCSGPDSDVDLLIELEQDRSLLDRVDMQAELEELLGRRVDGLSPRGLYAVIRDEILGEPVPL